MTGRCQIMRLTEEETQRLCECDAQTHSLRAEDLVQMPRVSLQDVRRQGDQIAVLYAVGEWTFVADGNKTRPF